jgi:hypothetical protein
MASCAGTAMMPHAAPSTTIAPGSPLRSGPAGVQADWGWPGAQNDLQISVQKFVREVKAYPKRIKALELY